METSSKYRVEPNPPAKISIAPDKRSQILKYKTENKIE